MRAVTAQVMRDMDKATIEERGVPGIVLMERAGAGAYRVATGLLPRRKSRVGIVCGKGNNGGDGFVVARHLAADGHEVDVFLACDPSEVEGDAARALAAMKSKGLHTRPAEEDALPGALARCDLIVDALLGTGISGSVREPAASLLRIMADAHRPLLAIDIPSGLDADTGQPLGAVPPAAATVTFGLPKLGLLQHPGCQFAGRVICVDIGIPGDVQDRARAILTEASDVAAWLPARAPDAHKGDAGRLLVVAGSPGLTGAGCLTARAASRAGSGLVTVAAPSELAALIEARSLETMTLPLRRCPEIVTEDGLVEIVEHVRGSDALAVGPGLGRHPTTLTAVRRLIAETDIPTVVDADGLQALRDKLRALPPGRRWAKTPMPSVVEPGEEEEPAEAPSADLMPVTSLSVRVRRGLRSSKSPLVLTPHPGEMAAILGSSIESVQENRVAAALEAAQQFGATIILKGARSVIADVDGRVAINPTGHEGMASGGMGDALTGIVVSLLGQGVPAFEAAAAGAYLHGLAAELAADAVGGRIGVLAGDLIEQLPATREAVQRGDVPPCPVEWLLSG